MDPVGVLTRKRRRLQRRKYWNKGPNYIWHVDGYDKLKPFGICISGCIDGFSRKIMWLKAGYTNNDPRVIGGYYINTVKEWNGFPRTIRTDMGTENGNIQHIQKYFDEVTVTYQTNSRLPPFLYGSSHTNQRIESWWSILRKHNSQFWINLFSELRNDGLFNGTFLDKSIVQYCFMDLIQNELNTIVLEWNSHYIRKNKNGTCPPGRPDLLYNFPEVYNCENYITEINSLHVQNCEDECIFLNSPCADEDVFNLCQIIAFEMNHNKPSDVFEAITLYTNLRNQILSLLL
ncbi:uncharacterized protein LOC116176151 [Photinus pyralis]|nr:uncharacterized protein LOC116163814 [Photinus pyralis]XP_031350486.1 uncharacterized protein LOC116176151 [Photinus pyralis]